MNREKRNDSQNEWNDSNRSNIVLTKPISASVSLLLTNETELLVRERMGEKMNECDWRESVERKGRSVRENEE